MSAISVLPSDSAVISTATTVTAAPVTILVDDALQARSRGASLEEMQSSLTALCEVVETGEYLNGTAAVLRITTQLDVSFPRVEASTEHRKCLHDIKHYLARMTVTFNIFDRHEPVDHLHTSMKHIFSLMEGLIGQLYKIPPTSSPISRVNIVEIAQSAHSMCLMRALECGVSLEALRIDLGRRKFVLANPRHSQATLRVLYNLMDNAVHHMADREPERSAPTVELNLRVIDETGRNFCRFEVVDNGSGIGSEIIPQLFKSGFRASAQSGSGVGLSSCKDLVELMGGEIGVSSEFGKGSTFWFTIPCLFEGEEIPVVKPIEKKPVKKTDFRVLIADDTEPIRHLLFFLLKSFEFENIEYAVDGEDALSKVMAAEKSPYNLIFMDRAMPNLCGDRATAAIRDYLGKLGVMQPVVFATSGDSEANEFGDDSFPKPFVKSALASLLEKHFVFS